MRKKVPYIIFAILFILLICLIGRYTTSNLKSKQQYENLKSSMTEMTEAIKETGENIKKDKTKYETTDEVEEKVIYETVEENKEETTIKETDVVPETEAEEYVNLNDYINHEPALTTVEHNSLKAINSDYRGWLNIPGTEISYPVPQGADNDFYLHKLFDVKQYEYAGSLFIDAYSSKLEDQDNLIIYGHNMRDETMFGTLKKFKDTTYFNEHPYIEFYTSDEKRVYLIFSVRTVSSNIKALDYKLEDFDTQKYIDNAISESTQFRNIDLTKGLFESNPYKQIITLSTCVGDDTKRLLISGIRIK